MSFKTIMLFPKSGDSSTINCIRNKYDPLTSILPFHITVVFPFEIDIDKEELEGIIERAICGIKPFKVILDGINMHTDLFGNYLFLGVKDDSGSIVKLHDRLYEALPNTKQYNHYIPHVTIGKFDNEKLLEDAFEKVKNISFNIECQIDAIFVEEGTTDSSTIIMRKEFYRN